jgi:hypothetical protein
MTNRTAVKEAIGNYSTDEIVTMLEVMDSRAETLTIAEIHISTALGSELEARWGIDYDDVEAMYSNGFGGSDLQAYKILTGRA